MSFPTHSSASISFMIPSFSPPFWDRESDLSNDGVDGIALGYTRHYRRTSPQKVLIFTFSKPIDDDNEDEYG